ncbi:hypothetical protein [Emticicia sp. 17c]|uniref:hypothetical protein n=1 Tax=Emticicia sp. 17c TaxID=3127704 RepID=UPI00301C4A16
MKFLKTALILIFFVFFLFIWVFPQVLRCAFIRYDNFSAIEKNVYVSASSTLKQQDSLKKYIKIAKKRIHEFWGGRQGEATLIFCNNLADYQQFCQTTEGAGCTIGTPFGSWIVINKDGLNADVIAHEMSHDELISRLGWWKTKTKVPTWFDEGLALMLDYRFVATQDTLQRYAAYTSELRFIAPKPIPLSSLISEKDFFGHGEYFTKAAYFTAAATIAKKIARKGKKGIYSTIDTLKQKNIFVF